MNARKLGLFIRHPLVWAIIISSMLYVMGVKWLFMPILIIVLTRYVPYPRPLQSVAARVMASILVYYVTCQIIATLLFIVMPSSNFNIIVALLAVVALAIIVLSTPQFTRRDIVWFSRLDTMWVIVGIVTLVPFARIIGGDDSYYRIAQIGGGQAIDATNHFAYIAEMLEQQRLAYQEGSYYPGGFHLATALIESSFINQQSDIGWRGTTLLYATQYGIMLGLLSFAAVYFIATILGVYRLGNKHFTKLQWLSVSTVFGAGLTTLFFLPLIQHGFLNYIYSIATIMLGCVFLFSKNTFSFYRYAGALVLFYGASVSWPLLIPVLIGMVGVHGLQVMTRKQVISIVRQPKIVFAFIGLLILHSIPIMFQLMFYGGDGSQGINLTGDLKVFRIGTLLLSLVVIGGIILDQKREDEEKAVVISALAPVTIFVAILALMQYFTAGEVRYYTIKTAIFMEMVLYVVVVLVVIQSLTRLPEKMWAKWTVLYLVPILFIATFAISDNPVASIRNLFRGEASQEKPKFFDADLSIYTRLGAEGKIRDYNSTIVHYNKEDEKFFAHMQIPFWANMMQYDGTDSDRHPLACINKLYVNLNFGGYTKAEQEEFQSILRRCITLSKDRNNTFYIITDKESYNMVEETFGEANVKVIDR